MNAISHFTIALMFAISCVTVEADDCPYKECLCTASDIDCSDLGLKAVPQKVTNKNPFSPSLHLENNEISSMPPGSIPPNITELYLTNNPLLIIDDSAFSDSTSTLGTVSLSNVVFTRIPDAFLSLTNLIHLTLSDCNISDWNINVMKHIGATTLALYLDNVGLTTWPDWIQYFTELTELKIVDNSISFIPDNGLISLNVSLTSLSLYSNALVSIPKAITRLTGLQMLFIQGNQISDVTWLSQTNVLFSLDLSSNQLADANNLSLSLRPHTNTMFDLNLNHNQLTKIPELSFLQGVTSLDISYNSIVDPISGSLPPQLFSLDLDNNNLPSFPNIVSSLVYITDFIVNTNAVSILRGSDFPPSVVNVVLAYNLITELTDTSFPANSKIENLNLNDNPISTISPTAFRNLLNLSVLDIRRSQLTRLPIGMISLTNLNHFDISGTYTLICTCSEKSLSTVIMSMKTENVIGHCGLTSIYNFFEKLSPSCTQHILH